MKLEKSKKKNSRIILKIIFVVISIGLIFLTNKITEKTNIPLVNTIRENVKKLNEKVASTSNVTNATNSWDTANKVTIVNSADGVKVPVPKGYTASSVTSERYVNGTTTQYEGTWGYAFTTTSFNNCNKTQDGNFYKKECSVNNENVTTVTVGESNFIEFGKYGGAFVIEWAVYCCPDDGFLTAKVYDADDEKNSIFETYNIAGTSYGESDDKIKSEICYIEVPKGDTKKYKITINFHVSPCNDSCTFKDENKYDKAYVKRVRYINYSASYGNVSKQTDSPNIKQILGHTTSTIAFSGSDAASRTVKVYQHQYGGFVIYQGTDKITDIAKAKKTRNQWVWVPVSDDALKRIKNTYSTAETYSGRNRPTLYYFDINGLNKCNNNNYEPKVSTNCDNEKYFAENQLQGMTKQKFLQNLQEEWEETITSIETYGGFWIGRYETGNLSNDVPVITGSNTDIEAKNDNWYTLYKKLQNIDTTNSVKTSMIWGCLWDETLQWFVDSKTLNYANLLMSNGWGNYYDSVVKSDDGKTELSGQFSTGDKLNSKLLATGCAKYTSANNVFDMAGNVVEWTLQLGTVNSMNNRVCRGSSYKHYGSSSGGSTYYKQFYPTTLIHNNEKDCIFGVRAFMYIK